MAKVTFPISPITANDFPKLSTLSDYLSNSRIVTQNNGKVVSTFESEGSVSLSFDNGFVGAAFKAYSKHHNLALRPDDVWLAIMVTFSGYIGAHAEEMRSLFVSHDGQKRLKIEAMAGTSQEFLIKKFTQMIDREIGQGIKDWALPNFTTTTPKDLMAGGIILMGTLKKYFSYYESTMCGLPGVTLEGTLEDWVRLRQKIDRFQEFPQQDLKKWHSLMAPILDEFIRSYKGNVDKEFWNKICDYVSGSGKSHITGWINVFIPFKDGKFIIREKLPGEKESQWGFIHTKDIFPGAVEVPVMINDQPHLLYAGSVLGQYNKSTNQLRPSVDIALIDISQ